MLAKVIGSRRSSISAARAQVIYWGGKVVSGGVEEDGVKEEDLEKEDLEEEDLKGLNGMVADGDGIAFRFVGKECSAV